MVLFIVVFFVVASCLFSCFLLLYPKWINHGLSFFVILNVVPFIGFGYLTSNAMRIGGIPVAYIPLVFLFINIVLASQCKINMETKKIFIVSITLLVVLFALSLIHISDGFFEFFAYYSMWCVNLFSMLFFASVTSKQQRQIIISFMKIYVYTIALCCVIGCAKFCLGIASDANFFPMVNRNGTIIPVVFALPLCLALYHIRLLSLFRTCCVFVAIMTMIILTKSRMGVLTGIFVIFVYFQLLALSHFQHIRYSLLSTNIRLGILAFFLAFFACGVSFALDKDDEFWTRLFSTKDSVIAFLKSEEIGDQERDYARQELLTSGIEVMKNNWVFGTGVGLENYRKEMIKYSTLERNSKPHNFFISYIGEFGIFGFTLLIIIFVFVFALFEKKRKANVHAISDMQRYFIIAFESLFLAFLFTLTMNEYVTFPFVWYFIGIGIGVTSNRSF